jgi:hypothetical protein
LSMVGMPVPESVDGSVLHEAFVTPAERPTAAVRDVAAARQTE